MTLPFFRWLKEDLGTKMISLSLALFLWIFVHIEERGRMVLRTTLQLINIPENLMVMSDLPGEIQVTVEGPKTMLSVLNPRLSPYRIDLKDVRPGITRIQVSPHNLRIPRGIDVVEVSPSTIMIELKETQTARIPVRVKLQGSPPAGYVINNVEIVPPQVEVIAPREVFAHLRFLYTEPVSLEGVTGTKTWIVPLELGDLKIKGITTQEVEVTLEIEPRTVEMEIAGVPVKVRGDEGSYYRAYPPRVTIRVRGPEPIVAPLKRTPPEAVVTLPPKPHPRASRYPVKIELPSGITLIQITPKEVLVKPQGKPLQ